MPSTKLPPPLTIASLRGGVNTTDPPLAIPEDQCVDCANVEWITSTLGERRQGMASIDLTGSGLTSTAKVTFLARHLPTNADADAELWALGVDGSNNPTLARKDTSWHAVTFDDDPDFTAPFTPFKFQSLSIHGKLFLAYQSANDRMHVWDGTSLRKAGIDAPAAAPTAANAGSGSLTGTRYYRVRWAVKSGSTVLRRSNPSDTLTFSPSGSGSSITVTAPSTSGAESPTHWELEASVDNANFYHIATTAVATTTYSDSQAYTTGYGDLGELSEDVDDYDLIPSAKYLAADEDRVLFAGSWSNSALGSRVMWTPVYGDPGVGNDERIPLDTNNFLDLDGFEGGDITGLSNPLNGFIYIFKFSHIYRLVRTGNRSQAYTAICLTKQRGALDGSITDGIDQTGAPCVYFLDPFVGPCRIGANGLEQCGADILATWQGVNVNAADVVSRAIYDPFKRQVKWWVATDDADSPNLLLVLQTNEMVSTPSGARKGWSFWTGPQAQAVAVCLFADNIDDNADRSSVLKPFVAVALPADTPTMFVHRTDTGNNDSGTEYTASITTRPIAPAGLLNEFSILAGSLIAKAASGVSVVVEAIRDFALETLSITVDLSPAASETQVLKRLDNLSFAELTTVQFTLSDPATNDAKAKWELNGLQCKVTTGQTS